MRVVDATVLLDELVEASPLSGEPATPLAEGRAFASLGMSFLSLLWKPVETVDEVGRRPEVTIKVGDICPESSAERVDAAK